jgi:hypothetical protein
MPRPYGFAAISVETPNSQLNRQEDCVSAVIRRLECSRTILSHSPDAYICSHSRETKWKLKIEAVATA